MRYLLFTLLLLPVFANAQEAAPVDFENDIAPILEERCWHCHGEDEQESNLRLDLRPKMLRGGDSGLSAVVPGKPEKSYLIEAINHVDEDMAMPPDEDKLPAEEIEVITRWIKQGANWPGQMDLVDEEKTDHWSFQPVVRSAVPKNEATESGPIDAFLFRTLTDTGLTFSKPADPRSLIRRVSIVLTGIAPTPEETKSFVSAFESNADEAYSVLVERLLASPHFGERWAQHWLDVIRWAETNGSEANLYRKNAWFYRDYVVRAFNEDIPYNQFVRDQIAGDSYHEGAATGFLVAGPHVPAATVGSEPSAVRQAKADRMDEILQTVGASVMGVTVGCARCHNHKFDPITIKDYYSLTGVFQDIEFGGRFAELPQEDPRSERATELRQAIDKLRDELRKLGGWEENWGAYREMHFQSVTTKGIRLRFKQQDVMLDELEVFGPVGNSENLAQQDGTIVSGYPEAGFGKNGPISLVNDGNYGTVGWRGKINGPKGKKAKSQQQEAANDGKTEKPKQIFVQYQFDAPQEISRLRLSNNREYYYDVDYLTKSHNLAKYEYDVDILQNDETWKPLVGTWFVKKKLNEKHSGRAAKLKQLQTLIKALGEEGPQASFVGRFVKPKITYVLHRGSPENPRDEVTPAGPAIFDGDLSLTSDDLGSKRRDAFANWIIRPENPLTARVMVNRIWHHVFGTGIVPTTSDFGKAGAPASHPELLDWLASEFVNPTVSDAKAWSMKSMVRQMVMSQAFRQSSKPSADGIKIDAGSALLWRYPPKRVEAEVIRDSVLQASGSLDRTIGGISYRIHNIKKTYAQWEVVDNHSEKTWRRMLYQERMRRVDDRIFTAFDFPDCGQVRAKRPVSTTPLQALNLMNSDFVLEQSKRIANRAQKEADGDETESIDRCFQLVLCRKPAEEERQACLQLAKESGLSLVCRALINSNEFAFLP